MKLSPEVTDSLTLKFAQIAREKNQDGERIISLGLGEPGFLTPESIARLTMFQLVGRFHIQMFDVR